MHHHRLLAFAVGFLALVLMAPALAQSWRGSEAISVQAANSKGKPISGARVVLTYQGGGSQGSPPEVATDQKGRAVVGSLATGSWQIEVQHPDFLSYVAVFDLQRGKKPSISASFLEAGGRSLTPMKVKLSKGNPRDASPPLPTREARSQPPVPVDSDQPTVEVETPTTPRSVEATPQPEPTAPEASSTREVVTSSPESEPAIQTAEVPESITPAPPTAALEDTPIAKTEEPESPEPLPAASLPAAPVEQVSEPRPETLSETVPAGEESPEPAPSVTTEPAVPSEARPTIEPETTAPEPSAPVPDLPEPSVPEPGGPAPERPETERPEIERSAPDEERAAADRPPISEVLSEVPAERPPVKDLPEPTAQPVVPAPIAEEAPRQEPLPEPMPGAQEQVEVAAPPAPAPEAPAVEKVPTPTAPAAAAPIAIPDETPAISTYRDGSCSECRTGEWAVTALQPVAAGSLPCPAEAQQAARAAAEDLGNSMQLELTGFVGPAADGSGREALASAEPEVSQAFRQRLAPHLGAASNCQMVSVVLPKSVRFAGFLYEAFDGGGGGECTPDRGCLLSRARWLANPVVQRGFNATVVWGIFENTAADQARYVKFKVYFRPPNSSWHPSNR